MRKHLRLILLASIAVGLITADTAFAGITELVSQSSTGVHANNESGNPSISADGRYVAFESNASNLFPNAGSSTDIYVRDRATGTTKLICISSYGDTENNPSFNPSISADGRYVVFQSYANNFIAGDTNSCSDIYECNLATGVIARVSVASDGSQLIGDSYNPSISADGRYVAFESYASSSYNLTSNIFVHDAVTGSTECVSVANDGSQGNGNSINSSISADGRYVAFESRASNLVSGDTNGLCDVFVRDRVAGTTQRVSAASDGSQWNVASDNPSISADGRYVAYQYNAFVMGNSVVIVYDRMTGSTERVSVASAGTQGSGENDWPSISADGRYVAFQSTATNILPGDTGLYDIFIHDRATGRTDRVAAAGDGTVGDGLSCRPSVSADGRFVAFYSNSTNLLPGVFGTDDKVYVHCTIAPGILVGYTSSGSIWHTENLKSWSRLLGSLSQMVIGDFNNDGVYDFAGVASDRSIWCTTDQTSWSKVPGQLKSIVVGDFNGDGKDGLAGLSPTGSIWYTTDMNSWANVPGTLSTIVTGDFLGSGKAGLAGLSSNGMVWCTTDMKTWTNVPGILSQLAVGDFNGDGKDDLIGLSTDGSIWYTTDKASWVRVPGYLSQIAIGDFNGDGKDDIVGLSANGGIWFTTDERNWTRIPGALKSIMTSDLNGDGKDDVVGLFENGSIWFTTDETNWTNVPGTLDKLFTTTRKHRGYADADTSSTLVVSNASLSSTEVTHGDTVTIQANVTSNKCITAVSAGVSKPDGTVVTLQMTLKPGTSSTYSTVFTTVQEIGVYRVVITATDGCHESSSGTLQFEVSGPPPPPV